MNRRDSYYRQLVAEADVDEWFDLAEDADHALMTDLGHIGILDGLDVSEAGVPNLTVEVDAGVAYDQTGQRMYVSSTQVVDLSVDSSSVSTTVANPGNIKWVSVFLKFKRTLSNPKTDGNSLTVQYNRAESFEFIIEQSTEDVAPSRPALKADAILLADIQRNHSDTTIANADISITRREWAFASTAGSYSIAAGQPEEAVAAMLAIFNTYVGLGAAGVAYAGGGTWADGGTNPATTVELQLDKIVTDLAAGTGAAKIGSAATGDVAATTVQGAIAELASEKGNKGTTNTWTQVNAFSGGITVSGGTLAVSTGVTLFAEGDVTIQAGSGGKTVTHKLLSSTAVNETTREFEVYYSGTPSSEVIDASPPDTYVTRYEIDVLVCRQGAIANNQTAKVLGAVRRSGATVTLVGTSTVGAVGSEGGALTLNVVSNQVTVDFAAAADPCYVRFIVKASSVKSA